MAIIDKFDNYTIVKVIKAYLVDGRSHRNIQKNILDLQKFYGNQMKII